MILLISSIFPPEPVVSATISHDLAVSLSENYEVKVLTPKPTRPLGFSFENQIDHEKFERIILNSFTYPKSRIFGRMRESYSFGKHAADFIKKNKSKIKCIYLHSWPLLSQYIVVKVSRKYSIPVVLRVVDIYPESLLDKLPLFKNLFIKLLLPIDIFVQKNASRIITISPKMEFFLIKSRRLNEKKVCVVYNYQDEGRFLAYQNSMGEKQGQEEYQERSILTFMFLGNLNRTASVDVIIKAFKNSGLKNSRLIIAGSGSEKDSLLSLAKSYQDSNIQFWSAPLTQVPEIQHKADVLLLNLKKGAARFALPSKLSAYMFSAKPIIACVDNESDTAISIKQADCGWVVPPENTDALSDAMIKAASIPESTMNELGKNGFQYAMENFSKEKNLKRLVGIVLDIVAM